MIWDEESKQWILRRHKKKIAKIPPVIEATKGDAYEVLRSSLWIGCLQEEGNGVRAEEAPERPKAAQEGEDEISQARESQEATVIVYKNI